MKTKNMLLLTISTLQQSSWLMPALIALTLVGAVFGGTGCKPHH